MPNTANLQHGSKAEPSRSRCPSPWEGKNTFVGGVAKCLRPEVLWPLYKPIVFHESLLAVLVYRLVCQPVTLESWVRLPDAALDQIIPIARPPRIRGGTSTDRLRAKTPAFIFLLDLSFRFFCREYVYHSFILSAFCRIDHKTETF